MVAYYATIKHFHLLTVAITIVMFMLRFYWQQAGSAMLQRRWVRIVPHLNDTLLFVSGILLVSITHFYPFSPQGSWLTEKLFGVIIYIVLGIIVLGRRPRSNKVRWIAFLVALVVIGLIIKLATSKMPLLGIV
ncbi:SirB2 family protein [Erwiniaceae bacterium BAC15a-03b]|uniref:SirB2 family protein n=1 Tax=Winslowiella arboricola TaxID=2978220 RepID=A0A9J6PWA6_9GAMM|nr:SirB2 family protein [Winslowiella arboricola]MCU5774859.1 SirB2 family protein [Winslowiella arboricola]MCU5779989.1 SirB2 family protein [Winslowiella arboricola]